MNIVDDYQYKIRQPQVGLYKMDLASINHTIQHWSNFERILEKDFVVECELLIPIGLEDSLVMY